MNTKKILIGSAIILLLCIGVLTYLYFKDANKTPSQDPNNITYEIKPLPNPEIPNSETLLLSTATDPVTTANFYKTATKMIESTVYLSNSKNYSVLYFSRDNYFLIDLMGYTVNELQKYRGEAEQVLLTVLNISKEDACKLKVQTNIGQTYNEELSGVDYGLSFCPNGIEIPGATPTGKFR